MTSLTKSTAFGAVRVMALLLSAAGAVHSAQAQTLMPARAAAAAQAADAGPAHRTSRYAAAAKLTPKAQTYYAAIWGVDRLRVSSTSAGNLIRFSYRVTDADRAKALADKATPPYLLAPKRNVALQVPVMEKIGPLRQTATPKAGEEYWMAFSNKGNLVRPGDRVSVMIGAFHAEGLVVE